MQWMSLPFSPEDIISEPEEHYQGLTQSFVKDLVKIQKFAKPEIMSRPMGKGALEKFEYKYYHKNYRRTIIYASEYLQPKFRLTEDNYPRWVQIGPAEDYRSRARDVLAEDMIRLSINEWIEHTSIRIKLATAIYDFFNEMSDTKIADIPNRWEQDVKNKIQQLGELMAELKEV